MIISDVLAKIFRRQVAPEVARLAELGETSERTLRRSARNLRQAASRESAIDLESAQRIPRGSGRPRSRGSGISDRYLNRVIDERSAELGLNTDAQRALEAGLLIDEPLLTVALAGGQTRPELLFGKKEWAGYLDARAFARRHGDRELTVPFIAEIYQRLAVRQDSIFAFGTRRCTLLHPLTDKEKSLIESNRYLKLVPTGTVPTRHGGIQFVVPSKEIEGELQSLCDWYNKARAHRGTEPYRLAAELQQRFVSIHPWPDHNGRSSRLLMNWSLERDNLPPSAPSDFNKDFFSTADEWTDQVRAGSHAYAERAARLDHLGDTAEPVTVFGLEHERERFLNLFGHTEPFNPGALHDFSLNQSILESLRGNRTPDSGVEG
ncbi:Fic family protein [Nocardia sp. NPDC050193]